MEFKLDPESYFKGQAVALSTVVWNIRVLNECGKQIDDKTFELLKKEMIRLSGELDDLARAILDQDVNARKKVTDAFDEVL